MSEPSSKKMNQNQPHTQKGFSFGNAERGTQTLANNSRKSSVFDRSDKLIQYGVEPKMREQSLYERQQGLKIGKNTPGPGQYDISNQTSSVVKKSFNKRL